MNAHLLPDYWPLLVSPVADPIREPTNEEAEVSGQQRLRAGAMGKEPHSLRR